MNKRKGISPVLATVILLAITLVVGVAIGGFAFNLFNGFTSTANVQALSASCTSDGSCGLVLQNTGNLGAMIDRVAVSGHTVTGLNATSVPANGNTQLGFSVGALSTPTVSGQVFLTSGSSVPFSATVS